MDQDLQIEFTEIREGFEVRLTTQISRSPYREGFDIEPIELPSELTTQVDDYLNDQLSNLFGSIQPFGESATQPSSELIIRLGDELTTQLPNESATQLPNESATQVASEPRTYQVQKPAIEQVKPTTEVLNWCDEHGWSDPHWVSAHADRRWWAFKGANMMPTPLPKRFSKLQLMRGSSPIPRRMGTTGGETPPDGLAGLRLDQLVMNMGFYRRDYERRLLDESLYEFRHFMAYLEYALRLLCRDKAFAVDYGITRRVNYGITRRFDATHAEITILPLQRVSVCEAFAPPQRMTERYVGLVVDVAFVERLMHGNDEGFALFVLEQALDVMTQLGLAPHPRWLVGTTEQRTRDFARDYDIPLQTFEQRDFDLSSPCHCEWCQRFR